MQSDPAEQLGDAWSSAVRSMTCAAAAAALDAAARPLCLLLRADAGLLLGAATLAWLGDTHAPALSCCCDRCCCCDKLAA